MEQVKKTRILLTAVITIFLTSICASAQVAEEGGPQPLSSSAPVVADNGKGAGQARHVFPVGQCTWGAALEFEKLTGQIVTWGGDGKDWVRNAAAAGRRTSTNPSDIVAHSIVSFGPGRYKDGSPNPHGHVAVVLSRNGQWVNLVEWNYERKEQRGTRSVKISELRSRYNFVGLIFP
jgi:surface antigen